MGGARVTSSLLNFGHLFTFPRFCWGLGGVVGAIVGATCEYSVHCAGSHLPNRDQVESPAQKWPGFTEKFPFFATYPYALPCAVASSVTFAGLFEYWPIIHALTFS